MNKPCITLKRYPDKLLEQHLHEEFMSDEKLGNLPRDGVGFEYWLRLKLNQHKMLSIEDYAEYRIEDIMSRYFAKYMAERIGA